MKGCSMLLVGYSEMEVLMPWVEYSKKAGRNSSGES
jgi:hypothetical protein